MISTLYFNFFNLRTAEVPARLARNVRALAAAEAAKKQQWKRAAAIAISGNRMEKILATVPGISVAHAVVVLF